MVVNSNKQELATILAVHDTTADSVISQGQTYASAQYHVYGMGAKCQDDVP